MTCIVGIESSDGIWIGGDSAGVGGDLSIETRCDEKVFLKDDFIMGFTSSFRMGQLLRYALTVPDRVVGQPDDMKYLVVDFMESVRDMFHDHGHMGEDEKRDEGGQWLMGYNGKLYTVHSDFQIGRTADGYAAAGCGEHYALGSLYATSHMQMTPHDRVQQALDAAQHHSAGVRGPYTIMKL